VKATVITIPNYRTLQLEHLVLDYNGTIAEDGILLDEVKALLPALCERYRVHVITADTFGSVAAQLEGFDVQITVLKSSDHTFEKAQYIGKLNAQHCAAVGNGSNDARMLKDARLAIAVLGPEGCSLQALSAADIACKNIGEALGLLLNEKRLVATLRR